MRLLALTLTLTLTLFACGDKGGDSGGSSEGDADDGGADGGEDGGDGGSDDCVPSADLEDCGTPEDDDCSGSTNDDGALGCSDWFVDADADGYGDASIDAACICVPEGDWNASEGDDCDDANDAVNPSAQELCATVGVDDDCDGEADELDAPDVRSFYLDADGDGYGDDASEGSVGCVAGDDQADVGGDCDDTDELINPGMDELCDGVDNDCDDATTDVSITTAWRRDDFTLPVSAHTTVPAAVAAAPSGGAVTVCPGEYSGHTVVASSLTLVGLGGSDVTVLNGGGTGVPLTISSGDVVVAGFTLTDGSQDFFGGGLDAFSHAGSLDASDLFLTGNRAGYGAGGAVASSGGWVLRDVFAAANTAETGGGGLFLSGVGEVEDTFVDDNVGGHGGGVDVYDGDVVATRLSVTANSARTGAGVYVYSDGSLTLNASLIAENIASSYGGGAWLSSSNGNYLESVDTDWGVDAEDNSPDDLYINYDAFYDDMGDAESFVCVSDYAACE